MLKNMTRLLLVFCAGVFVTGCASARTSTPGQTSAARRIETRFYAEDRPRLDQEMKGNFGYIMGTPQPEDRSQFPKTRRIYVFEVVHNVPEALQIQDVVIEPYVPAPSTPLPAVRREAQPQPERARPIVIPDLREVSAPQKTEQFEEYVIQDGDTLQKISKAFYGSYSQWTTIYEANKDVLKDPNRIRSGIRIRIPMLGASAPVENLK